ncbi:hypothetical protein PIB30_082457 [Stylosanthes scabra]|uniref:Uncharacterized protein n=1 Tax=Stylosanthes scabra TaxID=79078 RepID=A0ABU6XRU6_9FABA|nr:hypothetical protein [Stylosanthes scabra]
MARNLGTSGSQYIMNKYLKRMGNIVYRRVPGKPEISLKFLYRDFGQSFQLVCHFPDVFLYMEETFLVSTKLPLDGCRATGARLSGALRLVEITTFAPSFLIETQGYHQLVPHIDFSNNFVISIHVISDGFHNSLLHTKQSRERKPDVREPSNGPCGQVVEPVHCRAI